MEFREIFIAVIMVVFVQESKAFFGTDVALMIEIVSNTANQLNELERLVTNTEKYTDKITKYNDLISDEYFKAERIRYLAEELALKRDVKNLGGLNSAISELKYSMKELRGYLKSYGNIIHEEIKTKEEIEQVEKLRKIRNNRAKNQIDHSINSRTQGRSNQLNAQNTALIYESSLKLESKQDEIKGLLSTQNKLIAEKRSNELKIEIEKRKFYGIDSRENSKATSKVTSRLNRRQSR